MITASALLADSDSGKGSPIGLLVVLLLVIAVYFLWRSMNRHLRKVQTPPEPEGRPRPSEAGAASSRPSRAAAPPARPSLTVAADSRGWPVTGRRSLLGPDAPDRL